MNDSELIAWYTIIQALLVYYKERRDALERSVFSEFDLPELGTVTKEIDGMQVTVKMGKRWRWDSGFDKRFGCRIKDTPKIKAIYKDGELRWSKEEK